MSVAAIASLVASLAALLTAVTALIHSVQTRAAVDSNSQATPRGATSSAPRRPPTTSSSK
jgi:hypothetical protein